MNLDLRVICRTSKVVYPENLLSLFRADFDTNFEDRGAFVIGVSKYVEEATRHADFVGFC